tara:strand:- start:700 stop:918 length:219 start_codon:yes stop_codon:yes gene_type:complete
MTSDKFVRITLVVIAVSLFKIAFFEVSTIKSAYANQVHKIALCDKSGLNCADVFSTGGKSFPRLIGIWNGGR